MVVCAQILVGRTGIGHVTRFKWWRRVECTAVQDLWLHIEYRMLVTASALSSRSTSGVVNVERAQ